MARVVVDPIPRIEGHLRIEVEIENGKVKDAWSSGTLFRGLEIILQGRDPRDARSNNPAVVRGLHPGSLTRRGPGRGGCAEDQDPPYSETGAQPYPCRTEYA